ncbi:hypothetical protein [Cupriavidus consociatus]|uniref:hypothetical protein n=1 Tax=Cupriavidus consociatus TaxID=2821357 RepID=UPI001FD7F46F|nr:MULTISPECIES: hypothetical protein [unclassified Cupriavidus]MDK2656494.1 hypothetical protein [Cupriavidus sp. LEh21]
MASLDRYERKSTILAVSVLSALPLVVLGLSATSWVLIAAGGMGGVMLAAAACYIVFSIPVALFGPRTTNRSLEAVAGENSAAGAGMRSSQDTRVAA